MTITTPPPRSFLGDEYDHIRIGGSTLTRPNRRSYTIKDIVNAIEYTPNFNVRQSMTGGSRINDDSDSDSDSDEYLYGVVSG